MNEFLSSLENSSVGESIRQSFWLYPALEIVHILGIVLLVGAAFMFDLHLLGFSRNLSSASLYAWLAPWSSRGLWLIIPSGVLLFTSNAETLGKDPTFWLKMALLILAGLNVLVFKRFIFRLQPNSGMQAEIPFKAKVSAVVSAILWISIIACGRLLAY